MPPRFLLNAEDIFKNTGRTVQVAAALETGWLGAVPQVTFADLNAAIGFENFFYACRDLFQGLTPQFAGYGNLYPEVYDMLVIHDYSQFFSELYQVDPYHNSTPVTTLYTRPSPTPGATVIYWPTNDTPSPSPNQSLHHINLLLLGE